ncbi:hypothetical protein, partial [uncultured Duncaniella sp.]|uniref:hypothetical protein n=1 Tax=uncultured Duncaniella sp. TaxID=2768039 RepID=UPI0026759ED2
FFVYCIDHFGCILAAEHIRFAPIVGGHSLISAISDNGIDLIFNGLFMFRLPLSKEMDSGI